MNNTEYQGFWWLPSNPNELVAGVLTFKPSEIIELKLMGALVGNSGGNQDHVNLPIILGVVERKIITLSDCIRTKFNSSRPGYDSETYRVKFVFIGEHFQDPQEIQFNEVSIQSTYLSDWVDFPLIQTSSIDDTNNLQQFTFIYNQPESIKANIIEGEISVFYGWQNSRKLYDIDFKQLPYISIKVNQFISFEDLYSQYICPILDFLTLATGKPNFLEKIEFNLRKPDLKIIEMLLVNHSITPKETLLPDDLYFSLADIDSEFSLILQKWFNSFEELKSIFNLIFSTEYKPDMYLESKFLNIAQAAESYHRRRCKNHVLTKLEHEARIKAILDNTPEEYKKWLKEKLHFSNEPTLHNRLIELLDKTQKVMNPLVGDHLTFVRKVKYTRNYFTHWNTDLQDKAAQGEELFRITQTLLFMLQTCLLMELGCTPERCAELISKNKKYQYAVRNISKTEKSQATRRVQEAE